MESWLFLDIVVWQGAPIFQLFSCKDKTLLIWGNSFFVLDFGLHILNGVRWLHFKCDGFTSQGLYKDLHTSSKPKHQMQSWFFLDIVVWKCTSIFKLFASKNETLLIWRNSFFILDFCLHILNCVRRFNFKCDGFSSKGFDKNLHSSSQSQHKMKSRFLLDIVIWKCTAILQLFTSKDQSLLIRRDSLFILDLSFHIFNCVRWLHLKGDGLASQSLDKDLHCTSYLFWLT